MARELQFNHPELLAVWPGMGHVALNAGLYLIAKLDMDIIAEFDADKLFDVDQVEVKEGLIGKGRCPRNRFFLWTDPSRKHDLVVFLGEAQPPIGKYAFCQQLIGYAREIGVERIFTFAAMATQMHPEDPCRVFGAATDAETLAVLKEMDLEVLEEGHIGGLNGVLLGAAAESGLHGACLLGEMSHVFRRLPFPKASLAILEIFTAMMQMELDFSELAEQVQVMEEQLVELLAQMEGNEEQSGFEEETYDTEAAEEVRLSAADRERIERLFGLAVADRSKAFELKQELDRLGVFKDYEDRFLDLFKKVG